ncbi:MAG: type I-E CRISPR-associated protein Cse1/CasA [Acetobacteraceae bacterium]
MNLLEDIWLPVRRSSGATLAVRPSDLTVGLGEDPIIALAWPRPDFRLAGLEFLIGLLATACPPEDEEAWLEGWHHPPSPETLAAAFAPFARAFELDGPGPRFLQDLEDLPGDPDLPETLLIEAPGEATRRKNTALLVKPDRILRLSRAAAAMALYTLQTYAPSGGRGNLVSLRGGGPLTTLVLPGGEARTVWHTLWANVPQGRPPAASDLPRVFPWLAPTRTVDRFPLTTPPDAHPLQAFWGMPRRIRLDFAPNSANLPCDLTGETDSVIVTGWRQRPNGVKYANWDHPLSPYYKDAKSNGWLPVHPQSDGIGYRHWVAIALGEADVRRVARSISDWRTRSRDVPQAVRNEGRLLAAGYDMDNMKARSFVESEMPLPGSDPAKTETMAKLAHALVQAASIAASALRTAVRSACFDTKAKFDSAQLAAVSDAFWSMTAQPFFSIVNGEMPDDADAALLAVAPNWQKILRRTSLSLFDEAAPLDPSAASFDPKKIVAARRGLFSTLEGYGSFGTRLFAALLLSPPETTKKRALRKQREDSP